MEVTSAEDARAFELEAGVIALLVLGGAHEKDDMLEVVSKDRDRGVLIQEKEAERRQAHMSEQDSDFFGKFTNASSLQTCSLQ